MRSGGRGSTSRRRFLLGSTATAVCAGVGRGAAAAPFHGLAAASLGEAVDLGIDNIAREGLTDIAWFPQPFEIALLRHDREYRQRVAARARELVAAPRFDAANFSPLETIPIPKARHGGRRLCALAEPIDAVVYLALALLVGPALERQRVPAAQDIVYSYRLTPSPGRLFDRRYSFTGFLRAARQRGREGGLVAACDIGGFYDSIPIAGLRNALAAAGAPAHASDYLTDLLAFWSRDGQAGLPVGSNSSRILAEAVLNRVDRGLAAEGISYIRFVDDFRFFAADRTSAERAIAALGDLLARERLALNPTKTRFYEPVNDPGQPMPQPSPGGGQTPYPGYPGGGTYPSPEPPIYIPPPTYRPYPVQPVPPQFVPMPRSTPYAGLLPRYARRPNARELARIRNAAWTPQASDFASGGPADPILLQRAIRRAVFGGCAEFVRAIPTLLDRYPEFASYAVSALVHAAPHLPPALRSDVTDGIARALAAPETPDFAALKYLALLAHPAYRDQAALLRYARARAADPRGVCFRTALDALRSTGGIPAELRAICARGDGWSRRALLADMLEREAGTAPLQPVERDPFLAGLGEWLDRKQAPSRRRTVRALLQPAPATAVIRSALA